jgi:hypothetical protein
VQSNSAAQPVSVSAESVSEHIPSHTLTESPTIRYFKRLLDESHIAAFKFPSEFKIISDSAAARPKDSSFYRGLLILLEELVRMSDPDYQPLKHDSQTLSIIRQIPHRPHFVTQGDAMMISYRNFDRIRGFVN